MHGPLRIELQTVLAAFVDHALRDFGQAQAFVQAQPHILCHGQGVKQTKVLEHHGNAQLAGLLGIANLHRLAIKQHLTGIGLGAAVDNFHQG